MGRLKIGKCVMVVGGCVVGGVLAQDEAETCYGPGSVVGAVVGTLIVTVGLLTSAFFLYKMYWKNRKGKHLVLMSDAENPEEQYAFDNPCFREAASVKHIRDEKHGGKVEKSKWAGWPPVHAFGKEHKSEKVVSMDDSYLNDSRLKAVTLRSHDFTGLGFNICGNMRDGIFVKDVLHRGPAFESGCISTGDRIDSVCISFRNMVFEDALTILSYASPYDVHVQLENDSCSRPSTLMRSKRESSAVNCSDRILHPKFTRSQSVPHLNEMGNGNNKKVGHHTGVIQEKNRMNHSLNKWQDFGDYPTIKVSSPGSKSKSQKMSPLVGSKESPQAESRNRAVESHQTKSSDSQNKLHRFGIKVLPISMNPKMGVQSVSGGKKAGNETAPGEEKSGPPGKGAKPKELSRNASPVDEKLSAEEESDASKENVKAMLAKGLLSLKEKINQNTLGRRKKAEEESRTEEGGGSVTVAEVGGGGVAGQGAECPVPRRRSSVTCGVKAYEQSQQSQMMVPEEVFRAGDVARTNRKSVAEGRKGGEDLEGEGAGEGSRAEEGASESSESSDRESSKDETKKRKRSKGKAPSPPKGGATAKEINEIKSEAELLKDEARIFEPETKTLPLKAEEEPEGKRHPDYDSDSDAEPAPTPKNSPSTKIELSATQVTVHHSPAADGNDDDVEPSRKAASLGDLSRLDSDQPLSIVLERAVSLDLTEGTSQCAKKRKAPLPPSEEFPPVFDDRSYRKEPRLEGLTTFQRRLKKSSDFGTLEEALHDDSKPSQLEPNKLPAHDLSEAHSYNIQEFSSWLAECRRPKAPQDDPPIASRDNPKVTATSFVNINSTDCPEDDTKFHAGNVSFRVNGTNFPDFEMPHSSSENIHFPTATSRTVVVISQPNSLEPPIIDPPPVSEPHAHTTNGSNHLRDPSPSTSPPPSPSPQPPTTHSPPTTSNTLSSPLSSPRTYVTEIKVSTPERITPKPHPDTPTPPSVADRIHTFDSRDPPHASFPKTLAEASKIPIRTMKSETGQRVLATIQSLAKESSSSAKTPQVEYAKRVASLFSNSQRNQLALGNDEPLQTDTPRLNVSGLYLKPSPPKPSKDYSPSRKVPPVVPPRKIETSLAASSRVTLGLTAPPPESQERNLVTFSSFVGRNQNQTDDPALPPSPSKISFNVNKPQPQPQPQPQGELNGRQDADVSPTPSATHPDFDAQDASDAF